MICHTQALATQERWTSHLRALDERRDSGEESQKAAVAGEIARLFLAVLPSAIGGDVMSGFTTSLSLLAGGQT